MASTDDLTDAEIRLRLTELGYPVGPITVTTRKVMMKKLKYLQEQVKSKGNLAGDKNSLAKFSSGEESEDDAIGTKNRRSMPPPLVKSPPKRRSLGRRGTLDSNFNGDVTEIPIPSASSTLNSLDGNIDTGSRSERFSPKQILTPPSKTNTTPKPYRSKTTPPRMSIASNLQYRSRRTQAESYDTGSDTDGLEEINNKNVPTPGRNYVPPISNLSSGLSSTRSRFQTQAGSFGNIGLNNDSSKMSPRDSNSSPFSSDFLRRLAATSNISGSGTGLASQLLDVKESDDEDVNSPRTQAYQYSGSSKRGPVSTIEGAFWKNSSLVSRILLIVVAIFFCGLAIVYLNVRFQDTQISPKDTIYPTCKTGGKPGANCILNTEAKAAFNLFEQLYSVLYERAKEAACGSGVNTLPLDQKQVTQILVEKTQQSVWDIDKQFGNVKVLIDANPQWGVEVTDAGFNIPNPNLPFICYLHSLFFGIIGSALRLIIAGTVVLGVVKGVHWWMDRQEQNKKEVFRTVESIIDILSSHQQSTAGDNYLAISHVRDQLIPPQQRDKLASVWNKAVAYLEENESRVRTDVQQLHGEEFKVWRWLPAHRTNGKRKVWQGQAFETQEGSVNSLSVSPTPCLKIRHMFDSDVEIGEDWMTRVQDAILEKCENVRVLHIAIDKNSVEGCVYVKCASSADAGRAYRALHGSWFDGKLVTVKYLRLERYHDRFPDAKNYYQPMRPSNDRKLSLQQ